MRPYEVSPRGRAPSWSTARSVSHDWIGRIESTPVEEGDAYAQGGRLVQQGQTHHRVELYCFAVSARRSRGVRASAARRRWFGSSDEVAVRCSPSCANADGAPARSCARGSWKPSQPKSDANRVGRVPDSPIRGPNRAAKKTGSLSAAALAVGMMFASDACRRSDSAVQPQVQVLVTQVIQKDVPLYSIWVGTTVGFVNAQIRPKVEGFLLKQTYKDGDLV